MSTSDTVRDKYYKPLERAGIASGLLFWLISGLSLLVLFIDSATFPFAYDILQIIYIVGAFAFFLLGQIQRLYLFPRAEDQRRKQLLSNSYRVPLSHEQTEGYYNNDQTDPLKRLAASVMESAFFTKEVSRMMLFRQRITLAVYLVIYLIAALNRSTDLAVLAVAAQAVFSEEIIARWLRMEWLRNRSEQVCSDLNRLFTGAESFSKPAIESQAIEFFSFYETTKSTSAILLSSRVFHKHNERLTKEWETIRHRLGV